MYPLSAQCLWGKQATDPHCIQLHLGSAPKETSKERERKRKKERGQRRRKDRRIAPFLTVSGSRIAPDGKGGRTGRGWGSFGGQGDVGSLHRPPSLLLLLFLPLFLFLSHPHPLLIPILSSFLICISPFATWQYLILSSSSPLYAHVLSSLSPFFHLLTRNDR